jgi:hypothetical protein
MQPKPKDAHREIGRKLFASVLSEQLGLRSIDYTLRNHVPEEIDPWWGELGWKLQGAMAQSVVRRPKPAVEQNKKMDNTKPN